MCRTCGRILGKECMRKLRRRYTARRLWRYLNKYANVNTNEVYAELVERSDEGYDEVYSYHYGNFCSAILDCVKSRAEEFLKLPRPKIYTFEMFIAEVFENMNDLTSSPNDDGVRGHIYPCAENYFDHPCMTTFCQNILMRELNMVRVNVRRYSPSNDVYGYLH
jgi:hypothetical protein